MPALGFLAVAGLALIALLFVADAALEKSDSPVIATSQRSGLPDSALHSDKTNILTIAPAPEPDMSLQAVRDAQPKPEPQEKLKVHPTARAARAEAPPQNTYGAPQMNYQRQFQFQHQYQYQNRRSQEFDRFSIKGL
jgi:hypothetical protein